jgi:hypothetical protein
MMLGRARRNRYECMQLGFVGVSPGGETTTRFLLQACDGRQEKSAIGDRYVTYKSTINGIVP